ncbi:hypothetical protein [Rhizobium sp. 2MFCol3.1]|uniref:hypothetical protein n=1 Tax=unclassified Rhizobium TaxID=2613769 RepID=UPI000379B973|nr:hypothetical protein [Rhizobium sp. 2MFCol3.1]
MQLIDTHISTSANGTVTVEFKGEGLELVSVTMAGGDGSLDGDRAVLRAKEMMVQLTAFDDVGQGETVLQPNGGLTPSNIGSDADPIPNATPGSHIRAD